MDNIKAEHRRAIVNSLRSKAAAIRGGFYGRDPDNASWAADLRGAAKKIESGQERELSQSEFEELEHCDPLFSEIPNFEEWLDFITKEVPANG